MEFLIEIEVQIPHQVSAEERERLIEAERVRGEQLTAQGTLLAIWRVPGRFANRAIWSAPDATKLHEAISSLPLWPYTDVTVTPLAQHRLGASCQGIPAGLVVPTTSETS
jgi:muconolactone D-isomerase